MKPHREQLGSLAEDLLHAAEVDFDEGSQRQQAIIATFLFGMIQGHGMAAGLSPPEVHALVLAVYQDALHYTPEAAAEGAHNCIEAIGPAGHQTMLAIIHRGIDGHGQHAEGDLAGLGRNIRSLLEQLGAV